MLECRIVSPLTTRSYEDIRSITVSGTEGLLGILPGHVPIITRLVSRSRIHLETVGGTVTVSLGGRSFFRFSGGVAEIISDAIDPE